MNSKNIEEKLSFLIKKHRKKAGLTQLELADLAGSSRRTATNATRRLQEFGLLQLVQVATFNLSNTYRLVDVTAGCANLATLYSSPVREWLTKHIEHDAFRWSGLNKTGFEVWAKLQEKEQVTTKKLEADYEKLRSRLRSVGDVNAEIADLRSRNAALKAKLKELAQSGITSWEPLPEIQGTKRNPETGGFL